MGGTTNLQHDTRNSGANGYLTDGRIVTIGANPNGLGIFDYIGKNRGTTARSNPCSQSSSLSESTALNLSHIGCIRVTADPTSAISVLAYTDGNLGNGANAGGTLGSGNAIMYDFCKSFNAFSTVAGQLVNNQCLIKPNIIMLYWAGSIAGVTQGFSVLGSRDGANWDTIATISDGARTWATGWVTYQLQSKRYYRFIRIVGETAGVKFFDGTYGFHELEFFGKIKFLKTSKI